MYSTMNDKQIKKIETINKRIDVQKAKAVIFLNKMVDLTYEKRLVVADRFENVERNFGTKKKPDMKTVRCMRFYDDFKDDDTGEVITVDRFEMVEIDGVRVDHFGNPIRYYSIEDL